MTIDGVDIGAIIEAIGVPAALILAVVFLFLRYPPVHPVAPEASMIEELRRVTAALQTLTNTVAAMEGPQKKLAEEVKELALKIAEMNGRLQR